MTTNPIIDASLQLSPELLALGEFLGLLIAGPDTGSVELDRAWFDDPHAALASAGRRMNRLVELVALTLGPPTSMPSPPPSTEFPDLLWYPLPAANSGTRTAFHVACSAADATEGQLGLGVVSRWGAEQAPVQVSAYVPLVAYGPAGSQLVLATPAYPLRVLLRAGGDDTTFEVRSRDDAGDGPIRFNALDVSAKIDLSGGSDPTTWLQFEGIDPEGPGESGPFTSLDQLLDPTVQAQLLAVVLQASGWLSIYVGNAPFCVGEVLEAAGFVCRDPDYRDENIRNIQDLRTRLTAEHKTPISTFVWNNLSPSTQALLADPETGDLACIPALVPDLNGILDLPSIHTRERFAGIAPSPQTYALLQDQRLAGKTGAESPLVRRLNWWLLRDAYSGDVFANDYALVLDALQGLSALDIALRFVFAVLDCLAAAHYPIISLPGSGGGVYVVRRTYPDESLVYGLRVGGELPLAGDDPRTEAVSETPATRAALAVGTWLGAENASDNWVLRSAPDDPQASEFPGVSLSFLRRDAQDALSFAPEFELCSVGLDLSGRAAEPLFSIGGYTLQGAQVRAYYNSRSGRFGVGAALTGLGIPLGPGFGRATAETDNKVAQSLLDSGGGDGGATRPAGDADPVNPAFGLALSWVAQGPFVAQLLDADGTPADQLVIPIQRSFGPLECDRIGLAYRSADGTLSFLFWGGLDLRAMHVGLNGLTVTVPIDAPGEFSRYGFDLAGVDVSLETPSVAFSAALEKLPPDPTANPPRSWIQYDGTASLRVGKLELAALGSYAYVGSSSSGYTSLFAFALLRAPLGDPTGTGLCFVQGISAGFGYNRGLILPPVARVADFPLVAGLSNPSLLGGSRASPAEALAALGSAVPPERGQYWLAAGVYVVSCDLIHTSALASVSFGERVEIGLTGLSWLSLPPPARPDAAQRDRFAYFQLSFQATVEPARGELKISATLSDNSFVFDPQCRISGGMAFRSYFGSSRYAGKWVLSVGGYHPTYRRPSYFPAVSRLGVNWRVSRELSLSGSAYFALTPSSAMTGGRLDLSYDDHDGLTAWFLADANTYAQWAPFYFSLEVSVSVGYRYKTRLHTFKGNKGARLRLWGPPFGGQLKVDLGPIPLKIEFGRSNTRQRALAASSGDTPPPPLAWTDAAGTGFAQTLLPRTLPGSSLRPGPADGAADRPGETSSAIFQLSANRGLVDELSGPGTRQGASVWLARPDAFEWSAHSEVPATAVQLSTGADSEPLVLEPSRSDGYRLGIRPMRATLESSVTTITLRQLPSRRILDLPARFDAQRLEQDLSAAKWGLPLARGEAPAPDEQIPGLLLGIAQVRAVAPALTPTGDALLAIDVPASLGCDPAAGPEQPSPHPLPLDPDPVPVGPVPRAAPGTRALIRETLTRPEVAQRRTEIFVLLRLHNLDPRTNQTPSAFAADPGAYLDGAPRVLAPVPLP